MEIKASSKVLMLTGIHPHIEDFIFVTASGEPEKLQGMVSVFGIKVSGSLFNEMNKQNKISRKYRD